LWTGNSLTSAGHYSAQVAFGSKNTSYSQEGTIQGFIGEVILFKRGSKQDLLSPTRSFGDMCSSGRGGEEW